MTDKLLLRIEAVNLGQYVYDTNNLSVIRGACVTLLSWPQYLLDEDIPDTYPWLRKAKLEPISRGASSLLAGVEGVGSGNVAALCEEADSLLYSRLPYAMFVVDAAPLTGGFADAVRRVTTANRLRQMRRLNVAIPEFDNDANSYCDIDRTHPAAVEADSSKVRDDSIRWISKSADARLKEGRQEKATWDRILGREEIRRFEGYGEFRSTWDLEELTARRADPSGEPDELARLAGKMAVIYADGNKFGSIAAKAERDGLEPLKKWDKFLREKRAVLVHELLAKTMQDQEWMVDIGGRQGGPRWRIETLLWGGDEHIWVVPAWKGLETLKWFFEHTSRWRWGGKPLTHAAGIVLCSHKAPIRGVVALARWLAEQTKSHCRNQDAFAYQVLESFDHLGEDAEDVRALRRPPGVDDGDMILPAAALAALEGWKECLSADGFPRRRIHMTAASLFRGEEAYADTINRTAELIGARGASGVLGAKVFPPEVRPQSAQNYARLREAAETMAAATGEELQELSARLAALVPEEPWTTEKAAWLHLAELWDYLSPLGGGEEKGQAGDRVESPVATTDRTAGA